MSLLVLLLDYINYNKNVVCKIYSILNALTLNDYNSKGYRWSYSWCVGPPRASQIKRSSTFGEARKHTLYIQLYCIMLYTFVYVIDTGMSKPEYDYDP